MVNRFSLGNNETHEFLCYIFKNQVLSEELNVKVVDSVYWQCELNIFNFNVCKHLIKNDEHQNQNTPELLYNKCSNMNLKIDECDVDFVDFLIKDEVTEYSALWEHLDVMFENFTQYKY